MVRVPPEGIRPAAGIGVQCATRMETRRKAEEISVVDLGQIAQRQPRVVEVDTMGSHRCEMSPGLASTLGSIEGMNQGEYFDSSVS